MDYSQIFAISAAGMDLERSRLDVAALNLANAHTVAGANGQNYQPLRVVARASQAGAGGFDDMVTRGLGMMPAVTVEPALTSPRMVHEPGHPLADERGFVSYPGIDTATEMFNMMSAIRSYEANVAAMTAARSMMVKALEIGG